MDKTNHKKNSQTKNRKMNALPLGALAALLVSSLLAPTATAVPCGGSGPLYGQAQDCVAYTSNTAQAAIGEVRTQIDGAVTLLGGTVEGQRAEAQAAIDALQLAVQEALDALQDVIDQAAAEAQDNITATQETLDEGVAAAQSALAVVGITADAILGLGGEQLADRMEDVLAISEFLQERLVDLTVLVGNLPGMLEDLIQEAVDRVLAAYQATVAWASCVVIGPDGCSEPFPVEV